VIPSENFHSIFVTKKCAVVEICTFQYNNGNMKKFLLPTIIFLFGVNLSAQTKKTFTVNPGEKIVEAIPITEIYTNAEFRLGTVALKNGTSAFVKLNYNSIFGEMQFINPQNGDTISIAEEKNVKFVAIEKDTFYFDEAWLQLIDSDSTIKLAKKKSLEMVNKEKLGAMEVPGFAAIETYSKFTGSQHMKEIVAKERLTFAEHKTYYFGDRFNHFSKANKKSLLNLYRSNETKIEGWLKDAKIDFSNEGDLKRLFNFLQEL
jgi:hypothetical protein